MHKSDFRMSLFSFSEEKKIQAELYSTALYSTVTIQYNSIRLMGTFKKKKKGSIVFL